MATKTESKTIEEFNEYTITNAHVQWTKEAVEEGNKHEDAVELGCTGSLNTETEIKIVSKICEGVPVKEWPVPQKMTATFIGHMPVSAVRKAFGLSNKDLKPGVYSYGVDSRGAGGIFTWETLNIEETISKYLAFPNGSFVGGLKLTLENGLDEIAPVEMQLTFMKDENRKFMYEAFDYELDDDVKEAWMKSFNPDLVKKLNPEGDEEEKDKNEQPPSGNDNDGSEVTEDE